MHGMNVWIFAITAALYADRTTSSPMMGGGMLPSSPLMGGGMLPMSSEGAWWKRPFQFHHGGFQLNNNATGEAPRPESAATRINSERVGGMVGDSFESAGEIIKNNSAGEGAPPPSKSGVDSERVGRILSDTFGAVGRIVKSSTAQPDKASGGGSTESSGGASAEATGDERSTPDDQHPVVKGSTAQPDQASDGGSTESSGNASAAASSDKRPSESSGDAPAAASSDERPASQTLHLNRRGLPVVPIGDLPLIGSGYPGHGGRSPTAPPSSHAGLKDRSPPSFGLPGPLGMVPQFSRFIGGAPGGHAISPLTGFV